MRSREKSKRLQSGGKKTSYTDLKKNTTINKQAINYYLSDEPTNYADDDEKC